MVTINDAIKCEKQIICSGCREAQSGDARMMSSALDSFNKAINTKTAGGGLNGYRFMLELVAGQMADDHGYDASIKRLQLLIEEIARARK